MVAWIFDEGTERYRDGGPERLESGNEAKEVLRGGPSYSQKGLICSEKN